MVYNIDFLLKFLGQETSSLLFQRVLEQHGPRFLARFIRNEWEEDYMPELLVGLFIWERTPEGWDYWRGVSDTLAKYISRVAERRQEREKVSQIEAE